MGSSFLILRQDGKRVCYDALTGERFPVELGDLVLTDAHTSADGRQLRWFQDESLTAFNIDSRTLTTLHLQTSDLSEGELLASYTFPGYTVCPL